MRIEIIGRHPDPDINWTNEEYQRFIELALSYEFRLTKQDANEAELTHIDGSKLNVTKHEVIYRRKRKKHVWNGYKSTPFKEFKKSRNNIEKVLKNAQIKQN